MTANNSDHWWGQFQLSEHSVLEWQLGPLTLRCRYLNGEWQIGYQRAREDNDDQDSDWQRGPSDAPPDALEHCARYVFNHTNGQLHVMPQLPDRALVSRPRQPFNLIAGEEVLVYVSAPLWLTLDVGEKHQRLDDLAIQRPSDTWFGPSTLEGELCYATRSHCRRSLDELPRRPHRAIIPVLIRNHSDSLLPLERVAIPARSLPLYVAEDQRLWTPSVILERERDGDMAALRIDDKPPTEAGRCHPLASPRDTSSSKLFRAFNTLFKASTS